MRCPPSALHDVVIYCVNVGLCQGDSADGQCNRRGAFRRRRFQVSVYLLDVHFSGFVHKIERGEELVAAEFIKQRRGTADICGRRRGKEPFIKAFHLADKLSIKIARYAALYAVNADHGRYTSCFRSGRLLPPLFAGLSRGGRGGRRDDLNFDVAPAGANVTVGNDRLSQTHEHRNLRLEHADSGVIHAVIDELLLLEVVEAVFQAVDLIVDAVVDVHKLFINIRLCLEEGVFLYERKLIPGDRAIIAVAIAIARAECRREGCTGSHARNIRLCITRVCAAESVNERGTDGCNAAKRRANDAEGGSALLCYIISHCINLL
nr:MAG TPA: hypothetical protein [Caudoviricetes sp.]